jgi:hypothetical protein
VRRTLAVTAAAGLLALGCSGGEEEILDLQATPGADSEPIDEPADPEPEVEETEESAEQPEPEDPYAVPDEIDEDYVERVINAILEVRSEILRGALSQQQGENLDPDLTALLFATTDGEERINGLDLFQAYIDDPGTRTNLLAPEDMSATTFAAEHLIHAEPERCIIVVGFWDNTGIVEDPRDQNDFVAFSLSRTPEGQGTSAGNPTPWQWRDNAAMVDGDGSIPREQWDELDYRSALDNTCEDL